MDDHAEFCRPISSRWRPVRAKRGITMVGLFSAAITRAERDAHSPYRDAMAAKRLARMTRAERRNWRGQRRNY